MHAADEIVLKIRQIRKSHTQPVVVALDGGSGAGKSTVAKAVQQLTDITLVQLDDFYTTSVPEADWPQQSVEERLQAVFEWERVRREALEPLRARRPGRWHAFDFLSGLRANGTYGLRHDVTEVAPATVILLEGLFSAAPPLADLVDLAVLIDVAVPERHRRMAARDEAGFLERWHAIWDDVETYYFNNVRPAASYDLVVTAVLEAAVEKNA